MLWPLAQGETINHILNSGGVTTPDELWQGSYEMFADDRRIRRQITLFIPLHSHARVLGPQQERTAPYLSVGNPPNQKILW
jgi:hypothetical protein